MFPFLQLPTEIRLSIYKLVLPYSEYSVDPPRKNPVTWYSGNAAILFVNRQCYQEAVEILYRDNFFAIYIRHPRQPRLPFYDSRADAESFILISWSNRNRSWANPKNPRLSYSLLKQHSNFCKIRHIHVSLPPFNDLLGVDVYMQKTSYAASRSIKAWMKSCSECGGRITRKDRERMDYVQQIKGPIDEIGLLLQTLSRLEELCISLQAIERQLGFTEYMLRQFFALQNVNNVSACYAFEYGSNAKPGPLSGSDNDLLEVIKSKVEGTPNYVEQSYLPADMDDMFWLLQSIRAKQQRDPASIPSWTRAMRL